MVHIYRSNLKVLQQRTSFSLCNIKLLSKLLPSLFLHPLNFTCAHFSQSHTVFVFFSLHSLPFSSWVWTQLVFKSMGNVHSTQRFFCFLLLWNRHVRVGSVWHTFVFHPFVDVMLVRGRIHILLQQQVEHAQHTAGKCSLLCLLLPPDGFHHRATGLFLPRCSALYSSGDVDNRRSLQPESQQAPSSLHPHPVSHQQPVFVKTIRKQGEN